MLINQLGLEPPIPGRILLHNTTLDIEATGFEVATLQSVTTSVWQGNRFECKYVEIIRHTDSYTKKEFWFQSTKIINYWFLREMD
jgi:hypothetical protein